MDSAYSGEQLQILQSTKSDTISLDEEKSSGDSIEVSGYCVQIVWIPHRVLMQRNVSRQYGEFDAKYPLPRDNDIGHPQVHFNARY